MHLRCQAFEAISLQGLVLGHTQRWPSCAFRVDSQKYGMFKLLLKLIELPSSTESTAQTMSYF